MTTLIEQIELPPPSTAARELVPLTSLQRQLREIRAIAGNSHDPLAALARLNDEPIERLRARGTVYARTLVTCNEEQCAGSAYVDITITPEHIVSVSDSLVAACRPVRHSPIVERYSTLVAVDSAPQIGRTLLGLVRIDALRRSKAFSSTIAKRALRQTVKS